MNSGYGFHELFFYICFERLYVLGSYMVFG